MNKLVEKNSNIDERYNDLISDEAREKLEIREKADEILKQLKEEQKLRQSKKVKPTQTPIDKEAEEAKKQEEAKRIQTIEEARKRTETIRRARHNQERKQYEDRQRKIANLTEQLAFINDKSNEPIQSKRTSTIQKKPIQKSSMHSSSITHQPIPERVVIKEVIATPPEPKAQEPKKPVQALVPKKQKSSFMQHFKPFATKISEAAKTAYEMLTFKHNRDVAVGKRKERTVSPAEASNAYEKNMINYSSSQASFDVKSKNENEPTPFMKHYQAKVDEKAALEAANAKSSGKTNGSREIGA